MASGVFVMDVRTAAASPGFCRIALQPQRGNISTYKSHKHNGLLANLKGKSECHVGIVYKNSGWFRSKGLAPGQQAASLL
jgi:hypothetical protein